VRAVPHTAAKAQQQAHSLNGTEAWLYHVLQEGTISQEFGSSQHWQDTGLIVSTDNAYKSFQTFSKMQHEYRPDRKDVWSKKIRAALGPCVRDTRPDRTRSFQFGPLADCRRQFERHVGATSIEWEPEEDPSPSVDVRKQMTEDVDPSTLNELFHAPSIKPTLELEPDNLSEYETRNEQESD
jgi:hypothetical protein